jgi:hypothetical protein
MIKKNLNMKNYVNNPWNPVELFVNGNKVLSNAPIILLRGQANEVRLEKITPAIATSISLGLVNDAGLTIGADPDFKEWEEVIDGRVTWTVTAQDGTSGNVHLMAFSREVDDFLDLSCLVVSASLADELDIKIDDNPVSGDAGWFYRGVSRAVTATPKRGSPLAGYPVTLTCTIKSGLDSANVVSVPGFGDEQTVHNWSVTGSTKSGTFDLDLKVKGIATGITLPLSKLLSTSLADEADVNIRHLPVPAAGNVFFRNVGQTLTLIPKSASPLAGLPVTLTCAVKSGLDPENIKSSPNFEDEQTSYRWDITGKTKSGTFELRLAGKGMTTPITVPLSKLLSTNLLDEATPYLDGSPMVNGGRFIGGKSGRLILQYKNGNYLQDVPLALGWTPVTNLKEGDLGSDPDFRISTTSHEWDITGVQGKDGTFQLNLSSEGGEGQLLMPSNVLAAAKVTLRFISYTDHTDLVLPPEEFRWKIWVPMNYGVRILSPDGEPIEGVRVVFDGSDKNTAITNSSGVAFSRFSISYTYTGLKELTAEATVLSEKMSVRLLIRAHA